MKPLKKPQPFIPFSNIDSYNSDNVFEQLEWIPLAEYKNRQAYPTFFADMLKNIPSCPRHIVTAEA